MLMEGILIGVWDVNGRDVNWNIGMFLSILVFDKNGLEVLKYLRTYHTLFLNSVFHSTLL